MAELECKLLQTLGHLFALSSTFAMSKSTNPSFISYYGGKLSMLKEIIPRIPEHKLYTEVFFGSGAVFFAKKPSAQEVINDKDHRIINFFEQIKTNFIALKEKVDATLFSRASYKVAQVMWQMPELFSPLQRAWSFFIGCNMGFAGNIAGGWGYDKYGKRASTFLNKKLKFDLSIVDRLNPVTIECNDAVKVLSVYDSPEAFHYVDPPYVDTHQGHYKGYTLDDYRRLLDQLSKLKGKFLLSSFPSEILDEYIEKNGWYTIAFDKVLAASKSTSGKTKPRKVEVLTANYPIA